MNQFGRSEYPVVFRERVLQCLKDGRTQAQVARDFKIPRQLVSFWNKKKLETGTLKTSPRTGRPKVTTERQDRMISMMSKADPKRTASDINKNLAEYHNLKIHTSTVKRRLAEAGLHGRRPSKKPLISAKNRKARLAFALAHQHWTQEDWSKVLWSDESKFNLFSSDGIKYVRRPVNRRNDVRYQVPTIKHGGGSVMVWGCFSNKGVGPLVRIDGIIDQLVYREILKNHMLPFAHEELSRSWIFQQDNDPKHRSKLLQEYFKKAKIKVLEWPSQNPDLNPIEHLWEELDRRARTQNYSNLMTFFKVLQEEWNEIPKNRIKNLVASMPRRCQAVIQSKGFATKY